MSSKLIFYPAIFQILITLGIFVGMTRAKARALAAGEVDVSRRALHPDAWPDHVLKFSNNIANQFETPVLFYTLCFMLWAVNGVSVLSLTLAWAYVATRVVHAYIHLGSNYVPYRKKVFMVGTLCLIGMTFLALLAVMHAS